MFDLLSILININNVYEKSFGIQQYSNIMYLINLKIEHKITFLNRIYNKTIKFCRD